MRLYRGCLLGVVCVCERVCTFTHQNAYTHHTFASVWVWACVTGQARWLGEVGRVGIGRDRGGRWGWVWGGSVCRSEPLFSPSLWRQWSWGGKNTQGRCVQSLRAWWRSSVRSLAVWKVHINWKTAAGKWSLQTQWEFIISTQGEAPFEVETRCL